MLVQFTQTNKVTTYVSTFHVTHVTGLGAGTTRIFVNGSHRSSSHILDVQGNVEDVIKKLNGGKDAA